MTSNKSGFTYEQAGVNIDAGNRLVEKIKHIAKRTKRPEVLAGLGGFAALFEIPLHKYKNPILVSSTDGVGTKLKLAIELQNYRSIGIDLVAMCVNDLVVMGAEPLFFLDYYATGQLDEHVAADVISGIGDGCLQAGASLVGGETAEMPRLYAKGDFDLAGFCVGIVEKNYIIDGNKISEDDVLIGLASSGIHSNGYSLVHYILEQNNIATNTPFEHSTLAETLLTPTRIYVKPILALLENHLAIHAMAHITGGGIVENLPRVLPSEFKAEINTQSWTRPAIFNWLQQQGDISADEMWRTFNCGIGMILCVPKSQSSKCINLLTQHGETAFEIGSISHRAAHEPSVVLIS